MDSANAEVQVAAVGAARLEIARLIESQARLGGRRQFGRPADHPRDILTSWGTSQGQEAGDQTPNTLWCPVRQMAEPFSRYAAEPNLGIRRSADRPAVHSRSDDLRYRGSDCRLHLVEHPPADGHRHGPRLCGTVVSRPPALYPRGDTDLPAAAARMEGHSSALRTVTLAARPVREAIPPY